MYVFNILCAFLWNKKKKLTARIPEVEKVKINMFIFVGRTYCPVYSYIYKLNTDAD